MSATLLISPRLLIYHSHSTIHQSTSHLFIDLFCQSQLAPVFFLGKWTDNPERVANNAGRATRNSEQVASKCKKCCQKIRKGGLGRGKSRHLKSGGRTVFPGNLDSSWRKGNRRGQVYMNTTQKRSDKTSLDLNFSGIGNFIRSRYLITSSSHLVHPAIPDCLFPSPGLGLRDGRLVTADD